MSAPTYIDAAIGSLASFDGRKAGEPYQVHISNDGAASYTEVINFASALDYDGNRFNGNVVDLMINPTFMMENEEKFRCLIIGAITQGFFQMQANVVSSAILIDAVKHPENHKGLIVRVWGFSAYFSDLPDTYKQVLIHRALVNEGKLAA
jgi:formate C-acetyltransferase